MSAKRAKASMIAGSVLVLASLLALAFLREGSSQEPPAPTLLEAAANADNTWALEGVMSSLPGDGTHQAVRLYPSGPGGSETWQLMRAWPSGHLDVLYQGGEGAPRRLDIGAGWRRDTFPLWVMGSAERLLVVGYDVVRNVPSGRSLTVSQPGFDLFEITPETTGEPRLLASGLDLGGFDTHVYGRLTDQGVTLCAGKRCVVVGFDGQVAVWPLEGLAGYEFVEVAFAANAVYAITRRAYDDRADGALDERMAEYFIAPLSAGEVVPTLIGEEGIPYKLDIEDGQPVWQQAVTAVELRDLFRYELSHMRNGGLMDFGENNLEGRVTWSQVYYLNGMLSLLSGELDALADDALKADVHRRLKPELELLASLAASEYPGYLVKRYSVNREPLMFALHLGRILRVLTRAQEIGIDSEAMTKAREQIHRELSSLERTVEKSAEREFDGKRYATLVYRSGYPFWADGLSVPFNFTSSYLEGLLSMRLSPDTIESSLKLLEPLIEQGGLREYPRTWKYWWGIPYEGWAADNSPSLNTRSWAGDKTGGGIAHITYRSSDAMALIAMARVAPERLESDYSDHFRSLVAQGWLLPLVNEELSLVGQTAALTPIVSRRFARSTTIWEIQSQVWALAALAEDLK